MISSQVLSFCVEFLLPCLRPKVNGKGNPDVLARDASWGHAVRAALAWASVAATRHQRGASARRSRSM